MQRLSEKMKIRGLGYLHSQDAGKHLYEVIEEESYEKKIKIKKWKEMERKE